MSSDRWTATRDAASRAASVARGVNGRPGAVDALRRIRRILPGDPGFGDPLSAAGSDGASTIARLADRLYDEEPRVTRELSLAGLQVWHATLERLGRGAVNQDVTLLFTDLVGFSTWAARAGDDAALHLLREVAKAIETPIVSSRGKVVKRLGDGVMAVFPSPRLAFAAAVAARERLRDVEVEGYRPQLRAGIHTGRPQVLGGDYLGVDVNIAARLAEKAGADEILLSETTMAGLDGDAVSARRKKTFQLTRVKGIPNGLAVYSVDTRG